MSDDADILAKLDAVANERMTESERFLAMWRVAQVQMPLPEAKLVAPSIIITMQTTDPALQARIDAWEAEGVAIGRLLDDDA